MTDDEIGALIRLPKHCTGSDFRPRLKYAQNEVDLDVRGEAGERFVLFLRMHVELREHFTCGLRWRPTQGPEINLLRLNGPHGPHQNLVERTWLPVACHVHKATERYIAAGKSAEGYAEETAAYHDIRGAYLVLAELASISGLPVFPNEQIRMFRG